MARAMQDWPMRLTRLIDHAEREHPARQLVATDPSGAATRMTWPEVARDGRKLAQALVRMGMKRGDRIATLAVNHLPHLTSWWGAMGMGGVIHTVNWRLFDDQIAWILNHAEDRVLLYDVQFEEVVARIRPKLETVEQFIRFDRDFAPLLASEDGDFAWVEGDERDLAMLCYTSGTTGNPKGVGYEHRSTLLHVLGTAIPDVFNLSSRSRFLPFVPLFHAGAWGVPFGCAMTGAKLVLTSASAPAVMLDTLAGEGATHGAGVPTVWSALFAEADKRGMAFPPLKQVHIGGSAAPRAMIRRFHDMGVEVRHLWGMTEMTPVGSGCAFPEDWDAMNADARVDYAARQGSVPFGVEMKIAGEDGENLPRDGESSGRLLVKGGWTVDTYYREPASALDAEGWFDTGDVAVLHPDGVMQITDRAKDVIKSGGEWISSIDIENIAVGAQGVACAAVIGVAHPKWDERPLLIIEPKPGAKPTKEQLLKHLNGKIAKWWMPDDVALVEKVPLGATGKINKLALRETFKDYKFPSTQAAE